ncbi:LapA family protein [Acidisoma sp.]|uniref:LapA family protein n=1 Tax=Acidisoma sp. TaxID=1872115 RepID=UPI003AFF9AA6
MLRLIPALILILILALFALSNRQPVTIGYWPTDYTTQVPLAVAILVGMAIAFVLGAAVVWVDHLGLGRRARRAESEVRRLKAQLADAEARKTPPSYTQGLPSMRRPEPVLPPPEG